MNDLFMHNLNCQIAANEAARKAKAIANAKINPKKGKPAYTYLHYIFKNGKATSQELVAIRPKAAKGDVYNRLRLFIERDKIVFTRTSYRGGDYVPAEGVTAKDLGIDLENPA